MTADNQALITLGKINGVYGVKGWVKVYSFTEVQEQIFSYSPWLVKRNGQWREVDLIAGKRHGKTLIATVDGVNTRDDALLLQGSEIATYRESLPQLPDDQFYWSDLVGLNVVNVDQQPFGVIVRLFETGANDVMVVDGERERWVPWLMGNVIKKVDLDAKLVIVDWDPEF